MRCDRRGECTKEKRKNKTKGTTKTSVRGEGKKNKNNIVMAKVPYNKRKDTGRWFG